MRWERLPDEVRGAAADAVGRGRRPAEGRSGPAPARRKPPAVRQGPADALAPAKERRGRAPRKAGKGTGAADAREELVKALGASRGAKANDRLREAAQAFERERFEEARSILKPIAELAPAATSVRELLGLSYYRLGRWADATKELEAFRAQAQTTEQHPVLADAYRALKRYGEVEDLWEELRQESPSADLVTEGRIVMAGAMADRGDLAGAIVLLARHQKNVKQPHVHHLRQAYSLADLYERAGDVTRARELFRWVFDHQPDFADAAERVAALS